MIIKSTPTKNFLKLDSNDVQVIRVTSQGDVTLQVKYEIDLVTAIRANTAVVEVALQRLNSLTKKKIETPEEALDSIRYRADRNSKKIKTEQASVIFSKKSDFTKHVDNSVASSLVGSDENTIESRLGTIPTTRIVTQKTATRIPEHIPVTQTPVYTSKEYSRSSLTSREASRQLIFRNNISPTSLVNQEETYVSTELAMQGVRPTNLAKSYDDVFEAALKRSLLGDILDIQTLADAGQSDSIPVRSYRSGRLAIVVESLRMPRSLYASKDTHVRVVIKALSKTGAAQSSVSAVVNLQEKEKHWTNAGAFKINSRGASISLQGPSNISNIDERVLDTTATSIYKTRADLYGAFAKNSISKENIDASSIQDTVGINTVGVNDRVEIWIKKNLSTILPSDESSWAKMQDALLSNTPELVTKNFIKSGRQSTSFLKVARIIPKNQTGDFVDIVFPGALCHLASSSVFLGSKSFAEVDNKFSSVSTFLYPGKVRIFISGIELLGTVMVTRRDLTLHEKTFTPLNIDEPIRVLKSDKSTIIFDDTNVKEEHIYEYSANVFTREGREIVTTGKSIIEYRLLNGNAVNMLIGQPIVSVDGSGIINVSFDLSGEVPKTTQSTIVDLLDRANLAQYFSDDIASDRSRLTDLLTFSVERVDLKTGEVESFGILTSDTFSDKDLQKINNVGPLKSDRKYRYIISANLRTPDTVIESAMRDEIDKTTGKSYTFEPSKFLKPSVLKRGTLSSTGKNVSEDIRCVFSEGFSGVQRFVDITTSTRRASIVSARVQKKSKTQVSVRWRVKGDLSLVDHFVIIGKCLGMNSIVGKQHNFSKKGSFEFVDKIFAARVGEVTYSVVPVYNDYSQGVPVIAGKITGLTETRVKK